MSSKATTDLSALQQAVLQKAGNDTQLAETVCLLAAACSEIYKVLDRTLVSAVGSANLFGDEQLTADVVAEQAMWRAVRSPNSHISTGASEEEPVLKETGQLGPYCCVWDPLDGSSIISANWAVGTIISLLDFGEISTSQDLVGKTARESVRASMIAVHGPRLVLVVAVNGVCLEFTEIDNKLVPSAKQLTVGDTKKRYFSPANLRATATHEGYRSLVHWYMQEKYTLRYSGGLVPDVYHMFVKGEGIFINPTTSEAPAKLRLLFEGIPLAHLIECAHGEATDGEGCKVLDTVISGMEHKIGFVGGSKMEVARCEGFLRGCFEER